MKSTPLQQAILNLDRGQRRAALALALATIVLLSGAIAAVIVISTGGLRPTPTTRLQSDYLRALDTESEAVRQAKAGGRAVNTDATVVQARADLALLEIQAGDTNSALTRARTLARQAPQSAEARYAYGMALAATRQIPASLTQYQTAADLAKNTDSELERSILSAYGDALTAARKPAQAYAAIKQAAGIPPASTDLYVKAAALATKQRNFQEAAADFLTAQTYDPQNTTAAAGLRQLEREHPDAVQAARQQQDQGRS